MSIGLAADLEPVEQFGLNDAAVFDLSVTKIRGMASGCHLKCLHFW